MQPVFLLNEYGNAIKNKQESGIFIEHSKTKKSKYCCHPPFHPPIFCRHSLKLLSPTLPKLMNWILLSPPPLSSDPDTTQKFGTCTGCLFSSLTLKQTGCQICTITPEPGCLFTVLFGTLSFVLTYLCFVQEINISFDVFNIFIVITDIQYKNLLGFPLKTTHFCVLIHCWADCWLFPQAICPPPPQKKKLV